MVRLTRASEGEVNGVDICSAAFVRRRQGFVDDVHRAFAILAQERAILSPSSFPSLRSLAVSSSQLAPPMSTSSDVELLGCGSRTQLDTDKDVVNCQSQKRTPPEDNAEGNQTSRRRRRSPSCSHPCMECPTDRPQGKCVHKAGHENSPWKDHICQRCIDFEEDPTGQSSRPALVHDDRVRSLIENGKTSPTTQSVVEHGPRPRCQCICDCPHRPARGNRWQCTSHCEALVCQSCVAHWRPVICHWCFNPFC